MIRSNPPLHFSSIDGSAVAFNMLCDSSTAPLSHSPTQCDSRIHEGSVRCLHTPWGFTVLPKALFKLFPSQQHPSCSQIKEPPRETPGSIVTIARGLVFCHFPSPPRCDEVLDCHAMRLSFILTRQPEILNGRVYVGSFTHEKAPRALFTPLGPRYDTPPLLVLMSKAHAFARVASRIRFVGVSNFERALKHSRFPPLVPQVEEVVGFSSFYMDAAMLLNRRVAPTLIAP